MMRTHRTKILSVAVAVGLVAVAGIVAAQSRGERPDCPGKIVCPQTGELICRDRCPTADPSRPDCPGQIVCPLTGELVCKDRCPLVKKGTPAETKRSDVSPCCERKG